MNSVNIILLMHCSLLIGILFTILSRLQHGYNPEEATTSFLYCYLTWRGQETMDEKFHLLIMVAITTKIINMK